MQINLFYLVFRNFLSLFRLHLWIAEKKKNILLTHFSMPLTSLFLLCVFHNLLCIESISVDSTFTYTRSVNLSI